MVKKPTVTKKKPARTAKTAAVTAESQEEPAQSAPIEKAEEKVVGTTCTFRELDDILMKDVGENIKNSGRWPLVIDTDGRTGTFLRYRNTNYLTAINRAEMDAERIRLALLGGIRFGKPFVLDMDSADMFDIVAELFDEIQSGLMDLVMSKEILKEENYMKLIRDSDDNSYQPNNFMHQFAFSFVFVILTKRHEPEKKLTDSCYTIRVIHA